MTQDYFARNDASAAGAMLAAAREEMDLTVSEVARHLKLSPAQVEALEEGAYERLPGRVFVRGFLRNYAKLLGIDPQPLLRRIDHEMPQPAVEEEPPPAPPAVMPTGEPSRWRVYAGIAAIVVAALAAYEFGFNGQPAGAPGDAETARALPAEQSAPVPATLPIASAHPVAPAAAAPSSGARPPGPAVDTEAAARARSGERELHFRFDTESWVEIRDGDNKVIFSKLNRAGSEERIAATPPLKLIVGNARGVRLNIDDREVDLSPHIRVAVARLTLE